MENEEGFSVDELRDWARDPRGTIFWDRIRGMFPEAITNMRLAVKKGLTIEAAAYQAHSETLEEILQMPDLIAQELNAEKEEKS
jgi:hypothetical protein